MGKKVDRDELRRRLEELLADARDAGLARELAEEWRALAQVAWSAGTPSRDPDAPSRDLAAPSRDLDAPPRAAEKIADASGAAQAIPMRFGMVGDSAPMKKVFHLLEKVAPSDVPVLIHGETGTGKELVARALHDYSPRKGKPFLAENCAAVPANLLESELFGHKKGSFTGAFTDRTGHFVAADGGTVFLDEIGDMPLAMQSKLLRVLQEGEVRPVGSNKTVHVNVRVVAATNKDLPAMCKTGAFREDLYFRLNVVTITLPPLRERAGDIHHLVRFLLASIGKDLGHEIEITPEALAALERWRWPGNVRELDNVIRRAAVFSKGAIGISELAPPIGAGA